MVKDYDFAGWVTKNDLLCSDGVVIRHDAFKDNDGMQVPLVWDHDHDSPDNVLGHVILHNQPTGVYGYGYLNNTSQAKNAKESIEHGDISAMSIFANKIKRQGQNVVHGKILEVSLVLAGANPGAMIDSIVTHNDEGDSESAIIYTGNLIHAADDILHADKGGSSDMNDDEKVTEPVEPSPSEKEKTIGEIIDSMNQEQKDAVNALIGSIVEQYGLDKEQPADESDPTDGRGNPDKKAIQQNDEGGEKMTHNLFEGKDNSEEALASRQKYNDAIKHAIEEKTTLKGVLDDEGLSHSITNIEALFPEAKAVTPTPGFLDDQNTASDKIVAGIRKSPFSRIKTIYADITAKEARAKGYIKGAEKLEEVFPILTRETTPQTVYKKQKLDRDDVVDITDFDVVSWVNGEMRVKLTQEMARAALVGDGREASDADKIKPDHIRPIISDDDIYTIKAQFKDASEFMEVLIRQRVAYQGSGQPSLFINPALLASIKLLKGTDGRFLFGEIQSNTELASRLDVKEIVSTSFMPADSAVLVNLSDYTFGATKGGEITSFDDFDIDFNQYKYLIETRLSGALVTPKSAIYLSQAPVAPEP